MPSVSIAGKELQRVHEMRYLGITFDRTLSGKDHISMIISKARKGLTALKTISYVKLPQRTLLILYQALILSVVDYGFGMLTLSRTQRERLDVIQNEGMRVILGCTRDTAAVAMRHLLDLPNMSERHKLAQVKAFLRVSADSQHPLHHKVGRNVTSRLKRGTEWMTQATNTIQPCCEVEEIRKGEAWVYIDDDAQKYTGVQATLGRECREWPEGAANAEVESIIEENSKPRDTIVFTDGSVQRGKKSGWAYTARIDGKTVSENAGATLTTTSSMCMEVKAITEALDWISRGGLHNNVIFVTDAMSTLQKVTMVCYMLTGSPPSRETH